MSLWRQFLVSASVVGQWDKATVVAPRAACLFSVARSAAFLSHLSCSLN